MKFLLSRFFFSIFSLVFVVMVDALPLQPSTQKVSEEHQVVVLGGGIGGLSSALYLARSGLTPLVIEGSSPGGLLTQSHSVQNWPGEQEIHGADLIQKVRRQAEENGAQFLSEDIISIDFSNSPFSISTRSPQTGEVKEIRAKACIVAMGTQPNFLGVPGETGSDGYWGHGVTNCAICDGPLYRDQVVGVVGGGDAAVLEALYLSEIAKEVNLFVRKNSLKATEKKRVETLLQKPNVKIFYETEVVSIEGDKEKVNGVVLKSKAKEPYKFSLDGVFLAIGSKPNTSLFKNALKLDEFGYILLKKDQETSRKGVYAIGDIVDPVYKQAISAAGDGAKAALQAQQFISDQGAALKKKKKVQIAQKKNSISTSSLVEITSIGHFESELSTKDKLVIVDFYASWCGPCKQIAPLLDSLAEQMPNKVKILKVNIDQFPSLAQSYKVRSVPTLLIFNSSAQLIDRKAGSVEIAQILKEIETDFDTIAAR